MKIGIDIRTLMDTHYSGVSEYTYHLLKEVLRLDTKNSYKLFYNSGRDVSARMPEFRSGNVEVVCSRYPNKLFNNIMQRIIKLPKIDRWLGVDLFFMPNIGYIALSPERQKIITIHDLSFLRYAEFFSAKRRMWHYIMNMSELLKKYDRIVAVSESTKNDIVELCGVEPDKISVIYSGIGSQFQAVADSDEKLEKTRQKYRLPAKFILFLGTLEPRKNVDGLIKAYDWLCEKNKCEDYELVIAGAKGWKNKAIFNAKRTSKNKDKIHFIGYVDNPDKPYLYNLASLFVYPSFYEGFGFPPVEAMACGTPVVASSASSLGEAVGEAAVMVDPYNVAQIALAIEQALHSEELRSRLVGRGLAKAKTFSWEDTAKKYLELFSG